MVLHYAYLKLKMPGPRRVITVNGNIECSLCTEGALYVSIDCYNPTRTWHLELEVCVMRYRIESDKCGPSEQCVIATAEGDDIED